MGESLARLDGSLRRMLASALALAIVAAGCAAAPAAAAVREGEKRVVVTAAGGGRAVVQRAPFELEFIDARGRSVLREVRNPRLDSQPLPETLDPEPLTVERTADNATYAPLSFELGTEVLEQWNAGLFTGDVLFSKRSGTVHFARGVESVQRVDGGARLAVSTTAARRLIVTIQRDGRGALSVHAEPTSSRGVITVGDSFRAAPGEGFYGFGGRHGSVNKRGEKLYGWTEQENLGGEPTIQAGTALLPGLVEEGTDYTIEELGGLPAIPDQLPGGLERYMAPGGPNAAYYPQAQFVSSRGFGFLLNQSAFSRWRMANDRGDAWQVQTAGDHLDYTVALGPGRARAMRTLTSLTGRHLVPPRWAQGSILSRVVRVPALPGLPAVETAESYRASIEQDLADMETYGVTPSAYVFEGWALLGDLDYVRDLIRRLHERGIQAIVYHRAYVANDALSTQPPGDFEQTMQEGLVATTATGQPYLFGANGGGDATLLDFSNPRTVDWWRQRIKLTLELGADGFMQDFGEQVQEDMHFHDGSTGRTMHNRYPVLFHRSTRRILDRYELNHPRSGRIWFFVRSGFSGRPGSAAFEMGTFPGDETTDWSGGSGLRSLAPDMLNRAVGGAWGYVTDIGGYTDVLSGPPTEELYNRWSEWSALTPYFRVHNSASSGTRMPWSYGPETLANWKRLAQLHANAIPYMRELWRRGRRTGMPVTRPLWLAAPEAPNSATESQQWQLGSDVLVAPVVEEGATTRTVSFPAGCWAQQGGEGMRVEGPGTATVSAPVGTLPYFFRCGTRPFPAP